VYARAIDATWRFAEHHGKISRSHPRSKRFGDFGDGAAICFPVTALYGERWMVGQQGRFRQRGRYADGKWRRHLHLDV